MSSRSARSLQISFFVFVLVSALAVAGCSSSKPAAMSQSGPTDFAADSASTAEAAAAAAVEARASPLHYTVDLSSPADDLFHVTLDVDDLSGENAIYQFASTAPGTYQIHDIGRFVRSFSAHGVDGTMIPSKRISTNQWEISDPASVTQIRYSIAETWDTPMDEHPIYMMVGTSIEADHTLINGHAVFGYPTGMQDRPLEITIDRDDSWTVGTALDRDSEGDFLADNYDHVVDSPILMGRLSLAGLDVMGTKIEIYTYSKTDKVHSDQILEATRDILNAAGEFLNGLPVERYTFLFHFEDVTMGAWEHSYSSEYVMAEAAFDEQIQSTIPDIVAHEFFHIVTPLNIHSEVVQEFNFVEPVASEHLWLYEGTTEWAAHAMQLRSGLITLDEYMNRISRKLKTDEQFDAAYSLSKLSLTSFQDEGHKQYGNIYQRGALVAGLLDLRLLELSGGSRGLREVLAELSALYGPDRAFDEAGFFDEFTAMTYPEIGDFFDSYVKSAEPLPIAEYYGMIGISYTAERATGEEIATAGVGIAFNGKAFVLGQVDEHAAECGFVVGDEFVGFNGKEVSTTNIHEIGGEFSALAANVPYELTVVRDGEEMVITCDKTTTEKIETHVFTIEDSPTQDHAALRESWTRNLPVANL